MALLPSGSQLTVCDSDQSFYKVWICLNCLRRVVYGSADPANHLPVAAYDNARGLVSAERLTYRRRPFGLTSIGWVWVDTDDESARRGLESEHETPPFGLLTSHYLNPLLRLRSSFRRKTPESTRNGFKLLTPRNLRRFITIPPCLFCVGVHGRVLGRG